MVPIGMGNSIRSIEAHMTIERNNATRDNNQPNEGIERHGAMVNRNGNNTAGPHSPHFWMELESEYHRAPCQWSTAKKDA
jgi:hypothetical protein